MGRFRDFFLGKQDLAIEVPVPEVKRSAGGLPDILPPALAEPVTLNKSLTVSAVYAAVDILCTWTAQLDVGVYRGGIEIPSPTFITQPEYGSSLYAFVRKTVTSLALTGNAYWKVSTNAAGAVVNVEVLNPLSMSVERDEKGKVTYRYNGYATEKLFTERDIKHLTTMLPPGRLTGLGPLEAASDSLKGVIDLRSFAANWFSDSGVPTGVLEVAADLDADEVEELQRKWHDNLRRKRTQVTDKNTKYRALTLDPQSAMFVEYQQFLVTEVARWFRIPANLLLASVDGNSMTYSNLQTDSRLFITSTLMTYMKPIEEGLTALLPRGQVVKFKTEAFLRADTKERYDAYKTAIDAGFMTTDEVRALENLPPLKKEVA